MFRLQVTTIRQTFQNMDMTCSVLTVWDHILFTFLDNKWLIMITCNRNTYKIYIIEYIVLFLTERLFI